MRKAAVICTLLTTSVLAGCMSAKPGAQIASPAPKGANHSFAYQVAYAAGITDGGLKDTVLSEQELRSSNLIGDSAMATISSPAGISSGTHFGISLVGNILADMGDKYDSQKPHLIAWMPKAMAPDSESAALKLREVLRASIEKALSATGHSAYTISDMEPKNDLLVELGYTTYFNDVSRSGDCEDSICYGVTDVYAPFISTSPDFAGGSEAWFFGHPDNKSRYDVGDLKNIQNQVGLLSALSAELPDWVYLYVPPRKFTISRDEKLKAPLVLHQGTPHFFVKSDG